MSKDVRRPLRFRSLEDARAEVDRLSASQRAGRLVCAGNWTMAQIVEHITKFIEGSLDGFSFRAPWILRVIGRAIKPWCIGKPMPRGVQLRGKSALLLPSDDAELEACLARFNAAMDRLRAGERMEAESPLFGPLTHDQWVQMHLRHAEHHLGYLRPQA